jgi:hypothetical protein
MSRFMDFPMLAAGFDNQDLLQPLHFISPPLFEIYDEYIETTFAPNEGRNPSGAGILKPIGLPKSVWKFPAITQAEMQLVRITFSLTGDSARVTMRVYNPIVDAYQTFNAIMDQTETPEDKWNGYEWRDIEFTFRNMRLITT